MFNWFKRRATERAPAKPARGTAAPPAPLNASRSGAPPPFAPSMPLPEVVAEGNTQADWSQWEDSMTALDSQMQSLLPSSRIHVRDTRPSQLDELDPFSGVRGKRPA
jgi:hypothetical protein